MLASLLTLFIIGILAIVAFAVVLAIVGAVLGLAFGLVGFLLFKVAPVVLLGYLLVRFLAPRSRRLTAADRKWLES
jgi:hypothetical protein